MSEKAETLKKISEDFFKFKSNMFNLLGLIKLLSFLCQEFIEEENYPNGDRYEAKCMLISLANIINETAKGEDSTLDEIDFWLDPLIKNL